MALTLDQLNHASAADAAQMLDGLYEHSPWIAEKALAQRPFASLAQLKHAMTRVLDEAGIDQQHGQSGAGCESAFHAFEWALIGFFSLRRVPDIDHREDLLIEDGGSLRRGFRILHKWPEFFEEFFSPRVSAFVDIGVWQQ